MKCNPLEQLCLLFIWARGVESPLAFSQEERKVGSRDTVEATQMALGLVPEVLDSVDVIFPVCEPFGVVDAAVLERRRRPARCRS